MSDASLGVHRSAWFPRFAALVVSILVCRDALYAAVIAKGKLAQVRPQGIVVRGATGDTPVPIVATTRVQVTAPADAADVPDGAPCVAVSGSIAPGKQNLERARLHVVAPNHRVSESSSHVRIDSQGGVTMQNVPGTFRRGATTAFVVAPRVEHLEHRADGTLHATKLSLSNRSIPLAEGSYSVEYNFGANLQMAGTDADVTVDGTPGNPATYRVAVYRTEPLKIPTAAAKK